MPDFLNKIKQDLKQNGEIVIHCKITPSSSVSQITDIRSDQVIKINIAAPADKGKANKELIKFLSREFIVDKFNIGIISGMTTRNKLVKIKAVFPSSKEGLGVV